MHWWAALAGAIVGLVAWPIVSWLARWSTGEPPSRLAIRPRTGEQVALGLALVAALAIVGGRVGPHPALTAFAVFAAVAVSLSAVDLGCHRLPDRLTIPSYGVGVVLLAVAAALGGAGADFVRALAAALALAGCYLLIHLVSPRSLGRGDVKYAGVIGLHLGWLGWSTVAVGAIGGFVVGGLVSLALITARRAGMRSRVAFGPSMVAGALLAIALGPAVNDGFLVWTA